MAVSHVQPGARRFSLDAGARPATAAVRLLRYVRIASAALAIGVVSLVTGLALYGATHAGLIHQGVSVSGIDLGGMSRVEAAAAIDAGYSSYMNTQLVLEHGERAFAVTPAGAGMAIDTDATLDRAMAVGRGGSLWGRSQRWAGSLLRGADVPAVVSIDEARALSALSTLTPGIVVAPTDAAIDMTAEQPTVVREEAGVGFDIGLTKAGIAGRVERRSSEPVLIATVPIEADVTAEALAPALATARGVTDTDVTIAGVDGQAWSISGSQLRTIVRVAPDGIASVDEEAVKGLVKELSRQSNRDAVDAQLVVDDAGVVSVIPEEASVAVEVQTSTDGIVAALARGDDAVALSIDQRQPRVTSVDAEEARVAIEAMIAAGVTITWEGDELRLGRDDLAAALVIESRPESDEPFVATLSSAVLTDLLAPVAERVDRPGSEPILRYVDGRIKVEEKGRSGEVVDIDGSVERVIKAVLGGYATSRLEMIDQTPTLDADAIERIELTDTLGESSTYYGTSSEPRRQNVETAVALETGWMVAPGDVFSYVEHIGAVEESQGFVTGLGIVADGAGGITTAPVIGGGICQVSTTIFQAAFWAGLQMVERTAHPYWIQSYGEAPFGMKGLDAMVNVETDPNADAITLDLVFRNTSDDWIAVVLTADGENVTTKILGKATGWTVEVDGPEIGNFETPDQETIYQDSPELAPGEERQVETAQDGFDASVVRRVLDEDGAVLETYEVVSTYGPAYNRVLRGTGG